MAETKTNPETPEETMEKPVKPKAKRKKELETGIIYLSRIPTRMTVKLIRDYFATYGEIGRLFLQPDEKAKGRKSSDHEKNRAFSEGWVEFTDKRIAKQVAATLNNTQVGGKRKSAWYEELWNIKYLSKFKWGHLNERLAYERQVHKARLRMEITQAKKESAHFIQNVERRQVQKRQEKKGEQTVTRDWEFKQRDTEDEILARKRKLEDRKGGGGKRRKAAKDSDKPANNKSFLKKIFSGGLEADSD